MRQKEADRLLQMITVIAIVASITEPDINKVIPTD